MPKSRLVKLNDYALLELTYEETTINTDSSGFTIIDNTIQEYLQVLNDNSSGPATGNVLDRSSVQIGTNQWVRTEQDVAIPYLSTDQRFDVTSLSAEAPLLQWNVTYDLVRVHILSGYTFTASSGFVLETSYPEANGTKNTRVSLETYVNGDDYIVFNTRPLVINGANYDKYIEFRIPSLADMVTEYNAAVDKQDAIAYYLTSDNGGFLTDGLIRFDFYEINEVNNINGYDYLTTGVPTYVSIEPQDQFSNLAAVIRQQGDYFEYYPTWDDAFISDYIAILNETRGRYVVIHELTVSEQVGFSQVYSSSNVILQTDDFDQPSLFKPILKNSDTSFSFSIDYTMRLTNETDGTQIIRTASVTSFEPKRFGKNSLKLNVRDDVVPYRVYNKVTNGPVFNLPVPKQDIRVQRIVAPSFYENNNISVSTGKMFIDKAGQFIPEDLFEWDIIFGQTEAIVLVSPFDNYFKFNVFRVTPDSIESLDLSTAQEIDIVFETSSGNKYRYSLYQPFPADQTTIVNQINDTKSGKLIFRVPASDSSRMIDDLPGKFYITVRNKNIVRARVSLDVASDLRGKEVTVPFIDWSQKSNDDLVTVYSNLKPYTIEKRYLEVIEVVPDGLTGEETVVYKGNVDKIDNYQSTLEKVDEIRNNAFITRLKAVKDREAALDQRTKDLNTRESQLDSKESTLKALEQALLGQQQTLQEQTENIQDQQTEFDRRNALLKKREEELQRLMEEAKNGQSSSVKELSEIIRALKEEIERLSKLNQGTTGSTGTGSGGTSQSGSGTGTGGRTGGGINVDAVIDDTNIWQDFFTGDLTTGAGQGTTDSNRTTSVSYDVYYVNTDTFVGRYEIRSYPTSGFTNEQKKALFDREFVNDPRTNGGKYTELKKKQSRVFQAGEKSYNSKWFVEKQNTGTTTGSNTGSGVGSTTKVRFAVIEIGSTAAFSNIRNYPIVSQTYEQENALVNSTYTRTIGSLSSFKVEVALDELYQKGKDDLARKQNTFLAGYSRFIDRLTKSIIEKEVPTSVNKTNDQSGSKTYLYGQKAKYVNSLVSEVADENTEVGYKIKESIAFGRIVNIPGSGSGASEWEAVFNMLASNNGLGDFNVSIPQAYTAMNDWLVSLAKFYDALILSLFSAKDQTTETGIITNLLELQPAARTEKVQAVEYFRVLRTLTNSATDSQVAYMTVADAANFIDLSQDIKVFTNQRYKKDLPAILEKTINGKNYVYDKKKPYQISDWISGFAPGTIESDWMIV